MVTTSPALCTASATNRGEPNHRPTLPLTMTRRRVSRDAIHAILCPRASRCIFSASLFILDTIRYCSLSNLRAMRAPHFGHGVRKQGEPGSFDTVKPQTVQMQFSGRPRLPEFPLPPPKQPCHHLPNPLPEPPGMKYLLSNVQWRNRNDAIVPIPRRISAICRAAVPAPTRWCMPGTKSARAM